MSFDRSVTENRTRVMLGLQATGTGTEAYLAPTAGNSAIVVRCLATMGNAADLTLSLKYADDASGTNATAWAENVPVWVDGVRESSDAKTYAITDASGNFVVDFIIDPATVPAGKFVGVSYANSNAANFLTTTLVERVAYQPTAS